MPSKTISYWQGRNALAATMEAQVSAKASAAIRAIGNAKRIDYMDACKVLFNCDEPGTLHWMAASSFIDWLKKQEARAHMSLPLNFCPKCWNLLRAEGDSVACLEGHTYPTVKIEAA
jgi:hypothetical protein